MWLFFPGGKNMDFSYTYLPFYERDAFLGGFLLNENSLNQNEFPTNLKAVIRGMVA
jgi:hypothetical protein